MSSVVLAKLTSVLVRETQGKGLMPDGTTRFSYNGQPLYHYMGCSTFSEYTVVAEVSLAKINPEANHEHVCLLGCGVTTGIGAVHNTAKVQPGDSVAVFGLGAIGLAVVQGARQAKAGRIIAIDTNPKKFDLARRFGATDCINPNDYDKPIKDVLLDINKWGIDHTFECIGNVNVMRAALESAHRGGRFWSGNLHPSIPVGHWSRMERFRVWRRERSFPVTGYG